MFGQLGDLAGMMKKVGEMQSKMKRIKAELETLTVSGASRDGSVRISISGDMKTVREIHISEALSGPALEAAVSDAVQNVMNLAKMESARRLSEAAGGIDLSGMGLE